MLQVGQRTRQRRAWAKPLDKLFSATLCLQPQGKTVSGAGLLDIFTRA